MLSFNLAIVGAIAIGLFLVTSIIQATRKKSKVGCWSNFLLFVGLLALVFSIITGINAEDSRPLTLPITVVSIASVLIAGIVVYVVERRQDEFQPMFSRGLLGIGIGVMLLVAFLFVPLIPEFVFPTPTPTPISAASLGEPQVVSNIVPTEQAQMTSTPRVTLEPTITSTPLPSPSPTRTRRAYAPPTASPTPEAQPVSEDCDARVTTNLNMRSEPTTDSEIVAIIPEGRFISILGRNTDEENSQWWQGEFESETGWVFGEFLELDPICIYGE